MKPNLHWSLKIPATRFSKSICKLVIVVVLCCVGGCQPYMISEDDQELASETLIKTLEAWKSGQLKSLLKQDPPIRFVDDDCLAGSQLTDYEFEQPDVPIVPFQNVKVSLELKDRHGHSLTKSVTYQVGVEPNLTVLRSDN